MNLSESIHLPMVSWAPSWEGWPVGTGRWLSLSTLPSWGPVWSAASRSGAPSTRKTGSCWRGSRGGPQRCQRAAAPPLWRQAEGAGLDQKAVLYVKSGATDQIIWISGDVIEKLEWKGKKLNKSKCPLCQSRRFERVPGLCSTGVLLLKERFYLLQ